MNNDILCCPACKTKLDHDLHCEVCNITFPVVKGIPILINEQNSIFSFDDFDEENAYSFFGTKNKLQVLKKLIPDTGVNYAAKENYELFSKILLQKKTTPRVLIVGGGVSGEGMSDLLKKQGIEFIHTDISFTDLPLIICDGHDLPFEDGSIDGVIIQAVLEHVLDPYRCVDEIYRVLKEDGIVYAETPFMQPVHGGAYDFTRFSWLGHRRLFRKFEEIKSDTCCGPGMVLATSWYYFLRSFTQNKLLLAFIRVCASFTSFFWKYFDYYLKKKPNTLDAASGNYFIGKKKDGYLLTDKELIRLYDLKKSSYGRNFK